MPAAADVPASPRETAPPVVPDGGARSANRIALALGALHMALRDDIIGPLKWDGPGAAMDFAYWRRSPVSCQGVELDLPLGLLTNRYGHRAGALGLRAGYAYLRRTAWSGGRASTFLGGSFGRNSDLQLYLDWDEEHLYWITTYDLAGVIQHEVRLAKGHGFEITLAVPMVSLVSRPPRSRYYKVDDFKNPGFYLSKPQENMSVAVFGELLSLDASLSYAFALKGSWAFWAKYGFQYRRYPEPETIRMSSSTFSLRVTHDF